MIDLASYRQDRYETVRRQPSEIHDHLETLITLVLENDIHTVIELGVRYGISTAALLYALGQTSGHLWSVDIDDRYNTKDPAWTFIGGHDLDPATLALLPTQVDMVFIDTEHTYDLTRTEITTYLPVVRSGGFVVAHGTAVEAFHEHTPGSQPPYPVARAINETLPMATYPRTEMTIGQGLTIVTKP